MQTASSSSKSRPHPKRSKDSRHVSQQTLWQSQKNSWLFLDRPLGKAARPSTFPFWPLLNSHSSLQVALPSTFAPRLPVYASTDQECTLALSPGSCSQPKKKLHRSSVSPTFHPFNIIRKEALSSQKTPL